MARKRKQPAPTWPEIRNYVAGQLLGERRRYEMRIEEEVNTLQAKVRSLERMLVALASDVHGTDASITSA